LPLTQQITYVNFQYSTNIYKDFERAIMGIWVNQLAPSSHLHSLKNPIFNPYLSIFHFMLSMVCFLFEEAKREKINVMQVSLNTHIFITYNRVNEKIYFCVNKFFYIYLFHYVIYLFIAFKRHDCKKFFYTYTTPCKCFVVCKCICHIPWMTYLFSIHIN
jgi:hypothetical protein